MTGTMDPEMKRLRQICDELTNDEERARSRAQVREDWLGEERAQVRKDSSHGDFGMYMIDEILSVRRNTLEIAGIFLRVVVGRAHELTRGVTLDDVWVVSFGDRVRRSIKSGQKLMKSSAALMSQITEVTEALSHQHTVEGLVALRAHHPRTLFVKSSRFVVPSEKCPLGPWYDCDGLYEGAISPFAPVRSLPYVVLFSGKDNTNVKQVASTIPCYRGEGE
jgi:hypothetical protein